MSATADDESLFFAVAARIAPASQGLSGAERAEFKRLVDRALAGRPWRERAQLSLFLQAIRWLPILRHARPFEALAPREQDAFLTWLERGPIPLLRQGFWGVKTLVYLGYYGRPSVWPSIGYHPDWSGNLRLHG